MATTTALTIAGNTQTALLPRRSVDYQAWLIAEIRNLAIVIGQEKALDSDGLRLGGTARALADTRQDVMISTFARCERECKFLPTPSEILLIYAQELKKKIDMEAAKHQAEADAAQARLRADREAHPENYVSVAQLVKEKGGANAIIGEGRERLRERLAPKHTIAEPKIHECPHCGGELPEGIADLRGLSWQALRSMADRKQDQAATVGALLDRINAGAKSKLPTETTNRGRRRTDKPEAQPQPAATE